jgi:hypothetical protein
MGFGKCCGTTDEGKQVEIEHLVQRGRKLQSRAVYETFAKAIVGVAGCLSRALRVPPGGRRKLKQG